MKFTAIALLSVFGAAAAGAPQVSISVRDGSFDGRDGLDPTVKWESSSSTGDIDLSYGVEAAARPTTDIASLPRSIWGKASTNISGWGVTARADVDCADFSTADVEVNADNEDNDVSVKMVASAGTGDFNVRSVEATKGLDIDGARLTVTPRINLKNDEKDVVINYNNGDSDVKLTASADSQEVELSHSTLNTDIKVVASADAQEVTVSQQIDDNNRVAPTINNNGDLSVEWERALGDDSSLTATLKPNDSIDVEWKEDAWTANVNMPLDGTEISGANVSIKRDVSF
jgi:hypothetical protein